MGFLDTLPDAIYAAFKDKLRTATYYEPATASSGVLDDLGDPQEVSHPAHGCQGFFENYSAVTMKQSGMEEGDLKVCLFASSLPAGVVPQKDGLVYMKLRWFQIRERKTDPAEALWELQSFELKKAPTL